jgi:transposase InsO family protein
MSPDAVAAALGTAARTLRGWKAKARAGELLAHGRGRRQRRSSVLERNRLLAEIEKEGLQIGVTPLKRRFPTMPRSEIRDLLRRLRAWHLARHVELVRELEWTEPGWVWAMDHTQPPAPVDGSHRTIFAVRDLGSGAQLLWEGEQRAAALEVARRLEELFTLHGAPLLLKSDNGSAFISEEVEEVCRRWGVRQLFSPPHWPGYNGSVESAIRWLKERTDYAACCRGEPGLWTGEDLQVALHQTNELPKQTERGGTPRRVVFAGREPVSPELRAALSKRYRYELELERRLRNLQGTNDEGRPQRATIERKAMSRALVALGVLTIKTRRVSPTLKSIAAA